MGCGDKQLNSPAEKTSFSGPKGSEDFLRRARNDLQNMDPKDFRVLRKPSSSTAESFLPEHSSFLPEELGTKLNSLPKKERSAPAAAEVDPDTVDGAKKRLKTAGDERRTPSDETLESPRLERPTTSDRLEPAASITPKSEAEKAREDFAQSGKKFSHALPKEERSKAHQELADNLKRIRALEGDKGVQNAVSKLNEDLEKSNSPYRFNTARMFNGQDFLTLRDKPAPGEPIQDGKFRGTIEISKPTTDAQRAQEEFARTGEKFSRELPKEERSKAHQELADNLKRIRALEGDKGVQNAVSKLNEDLEKSNSPYRFNTARMFNGQDFLTLRDKPAPGEPIQDGKFRGTIEISKPTTDAQRAQEEFARTGEKFSRELPKEERSKAHQELADNLKRIRALEGDKGVQNAVSKLNEDLEKSNSPYRFNTARMSNGQDFLTLRDKPAPGEPIQDGKYRGSIEISKPTTDAQRAQEEFARTGEKFSRELPKEERAKAHQELADNLKRIMALAGNKGVERAVAELNEALEKSNSPYRFNTARMSNGQDFLTLRDKPAPGEPIQDGKYRGTIEISEPKPDV